MYDDLIKIIKNNSSAMDAVKTAVEPEIYPFSKIKAVLFDIYGTLFISEAGDISHSSDNLSSAGISENINFLKTFNNLRHLNYFKFIF